MFEYFYHEILRRTVIGFGTLFNDINIRHTDSTDNTVSELKVPLAYGPTQKFLARLEQAADLNKPTQLSLPRMSFEMIGLSYDPARKVTSTQTFISSLESDKKKARKTFMPVPYNMAFELSVYTKLNDDMLQIVEQILPYFQPSYNLTIDLVDQIGEKEIFLWYLKALQCLMTMRATIKPEDPSIYLRFTAKSYLFGPISDPSKDIIKKVTVGYIAGGKTPTPSEMLHILHNQEQRRVMQIM